MFFLDSYGMEALASNKTSDEAPKQTDVRLKSWCCRKQDGAAENIKHGERMTNWR